MLVIGDQLLRDWGIGSGSVGAEAAGVTSLWVLVASPM